MNYSANGFVIGVNMTDDKRQLCEHGDWKDSCIVCHFIKANKIVDIFIVVVCAIILLWIFCQ
jgi:hypothetical protein